VVAGAAIEGTVRSRLTPFPPQERCCAQRLRTAATGGVEATERDGRAGQGEGGHREKLPQRIRHGGAWSVEGIRAALVRARGAGDGSESSWSGGNKEQGRDRRHRAVRGCRSCTPWSTQHATSSNVAFPSTRSSKQKKVCTAGFTRTRPRPPNKNPSRVPIFAE